MTGTEHPTVSLVVTVRNEEQSIGPLLDSIRAQTRPPDEVIVVDGGSTDRTLACLQAHAGGLPLRVIEAPGANIARGRNLGLRAATGTIVAVTDAGVRLDSHWLAELTAPFRLPPEQRPDVVSGFFRADPASRFELALGATTLPDLTDVDPGRFLPSSRSVAFGRRLYLAGFQYPEWLDYCEDLVFDLRLRRAGARFAFRPEAFVWFRPRPSLTAFWRQYFHYARGDGKAGLFARRHAVRYVTYCLALPWLLQRGRDRRRLALALAGGVLYMRQPWQRLLARKQRLPATTLLSVVALAPVLRLVGDLAKMAGYPVGLLWRARRYGLRASWRTIPEQRD